MTNDTLKELLLKYDVIKIGNYKLASKKLPKYYIDIKRGFTKPEILEFICKRITQEIMMTGIKFDCIACIELGGIPIAIVVSLKTGIPCIIIRKEDKEHGIKSRIIGDIEEGACAVIVEDVVTTGGSILDVIKLLRENEVIVKLVITVVDRKEGGEETLAKEGIAMISLINKNDLDDIIEGNGCESLEVSDNKSGIT